MMSTNLLRLLQLQQLLKMPTMGVDTLLSKSTTELDPENAVETQSDLFVLSSALEDCQQGTHVHLSGNVVVHHPVGSKIPHFHRVYEWRPNLATLVTRGKDDEADVEQLQLEEEEEGEEEEKEEGR
ncbi:hypothetical protein ANN_04494 [Periplaneta americana]|uniref:Uncharacterized protein n=1 Tax=Periplaneta americana TaxID=6978 RepID=A0ABQ8T8Q0_PERAM|nr:hypothetical protein ANN_04494 [Periplaneta americana]